MVVREKGLKFEGIRLKFILTRCPPLLLSALLIEAVSLAEPGLSSFLLA